MFVSIIVPTYKDTEALWLIFEALEKQTYKNFELIIAEDDNDTNLKDSLKNHNFSFRIKHYTQEDKGWRKARALNQSILLSEGEYLIFFDGDCLPYSTFVQAHVSLMEKNRILCGRRVNLGDNISQKLREKTLHVSDIEKKLFSFYRALKDDAARHIEQGIFLYKFPWIYNKIINILDKKKRLVGCNFSLYKEDIVKINGFDESYPSGDIADDVDIEWRLNAIGVTNKSCKYAANLLHLNHSRFDRKEAHKRNYTLMLEKQKNSLIKCKDGIIKCNCLD